MKISRNQILFILLLVQIFLVKSLVNYPEYVERFYSNGIYKGIAAFLRTVFGWLPFSLGDILYVLAIYWIIKSLWRFYKQKPKRWGKTVFSLLAKLSIVYFMFHLLWGFNYYRLPVQKSMNLVIPEYNIDELSLLTEKLMIKVQEMHFKIVKNDSLPVQLKDSKRKVYTMAGKSYEELEKYYPQFAYKRPKVKSSLFSLPLSYMGFSGYLNPFTNEAQVNYKIPKFTLPIVATHEIAHQLGYASESEANFIGFLAATKSEDPYFQFSGYLSALRYSLGEIYRSDKELYKEFISRLPLGIRKNLLENKTFWSDHKNPFNPLFKGFYDLFLKSNNQKSGIRGYGRMVGLLMAYQLDNEL